MSRSGSSPTITRFPLPGTTTKLRARMRRPACGANACVWNCAWTESYMLAMRVAISESAGVMHACPNPNQRSANHRARITTPVAKVPGCRASSTVRPRRCGGRWAKINSEDARFLKPKASAREFHHKQCVVPEGPPRRPVETTRVLIAVWRACADCFRSQLRRLGFWATPPGATPAGLCEHTMGFGNRASKPELSTWLGIGTFYLAPTDCVGGGLARLTGPTTKRQ